MEQLKTKVQLSLLLFVFSACTLFAQKSAMHFNRGDYLETIPNPVTSNDFTIEGWYKSTGTGNISACNGKEGHTLWYLGNLADDYLVLGECNGELFLYQRFGSNSVYLPNTGGTNIRGNWHHISVHVEDTSTGATPLEVEVYLDCNLIISDKLYNIDGVDLLFGRRGNVSDPLDDYEGSMDDIKVYPKSVSPQKVCDNKRCVSDIPSQLGLTAYFRFDNGIPGGNNSVHIDAFDYSNNGVIGKLVNFNLTGNSSNYILSDSPIFDPVDTYCPLMTSLPFRADTITQLCGDVATHLCLFDTSGQAILSYPAHMDEINWFYTIDGLNWLNIDPALQDLSCGVVSAGVFSIDCTSNSNGYEDWDIRAEIKFKDGVDSCYHYTKSTPLRMCCSLDDLSVEATTNHSMDLLCDMDSVDFDVKLSKNYPFLTNPAATTIRWSYNGTLLPQFDDMISFNYPNIVVDVTIGACFQAIVDLNDCGKSVTLNFCFPIDPKPICGTIDTLNKPTVLTQISASPKIYQICPGEDAALKILDPFSNCIPTWQYSFDQLSWQDLGSTNSKQNTNILPTSSWLGTNIYYRIECRPINDPSGCEPCHSDTIEIRIQNDFTAGSVTGVNQFCAGASTTLTHQGHDPSLQNEWICNGIPTGMTGPTFPATTSGCYWVNSTDGCYSHSTTPFCVEACVVEVILSCPDVCPREGVPVTIYACDSFDSCGLPLSYNWTSSSSTPPTINGCQITQILDAGSNVISVTVTNSIGCVSTNSITIVTCD